MLSSISTTLYMRSSSDDNTIKPILADIPFLAVGILAFCTLSFIVVMKRLTFVWACLHAAVLAAFVASVLDVSQVLSIDIGSDMGSATNTKPIAVARDIGIAVSVGLRLLFLWFYVAEPPREEENTTLADTGAHSGAWNRWGITGLVLKWLTFSKIVAIVALQLVWRIDQGMTAFSPVYNADIAMEVILSAMFLLKVGLNVWICTAASKLRILMAYSGLILALFFNISIEIGSFVTFKFTETVVGRFLQALEFYILIFSVLLAIFLRRKPVRMQTNTSDRISFFRLPSTSRESTFFIPPPHVSTPEIPSLASRGPYINMQDGRFARDSRRSSLSRLSLWLASRNPASRRSLPQENDQTQLWKHDEAEKADSPGPLVVNTSYGDKELDDQMSGLLSPLSSDYRQKRTAKVFTDRNTNSRNSNSPKSTDSPVYGLHGLHGPFAASLPPLHSKSPFHRLSRDSDRRATSMSSLFRQQIELEKSIAGLGLLGDQTTTEASGEVVSFSPISDDRSKYSKTESMSAPSDISLSNFPWPPTESDTNFSKTEAGARINVPRSSVEVIPGKRNRGEGASDSSVEDNDSPIYLRPPQMPAAVFDSRSEMSVTDPDLDPAFIVSARTPKFDSHGTQYDVTSFIGNLTHKKDESSSTKLTDSEPDEATIVTLDRSNSTKYARPIYVGSPLSKALPTGPSSSGVGRGTGTGSGSPRAGPASRPRLEISNPRFQGADAFIGAYEMPRPAPVVSPRGAGNVDKRR